MTSAHSLQGLMKWLTRAEWRDRFAEIYDHHLLPACRRTGLDAEEVMAILGENWFMTTVWGGAFEDFLTREGADGRNIVDDYLKRRGWKESASTRAYMSALRTSVMSLPVSRAAKRLAPLRDRPPGSCGPCFACRRSSGRLVRHPAHGREPTGRSRRTDSRLPDCVACAG